MIHTGAVASIRRQSEAGLADTLKAPVLVDAHAVEAHVGGRTLVVIWEKGGWGVKVTFPKVPVKPGLPGSPMQFFPSGVSSKPALQMHWKLPSVLMQRPLRHISPFTTHSSTSGGAEEGNVTEVLTGGVGGGGAQLRDAPMQACLVGVPW